MRKTIVVLAKCDLQIKDAKPSDELVETMVASNGRATKFAYSANEVVERALLAERRLQRTGLPQVKRIGFEARFDHCGPWAKAYKFIASGRSVILRRTAKGWILKSVDAISVYPAQDERISFFATPSQIEEIKRRSVVDISLAQT